MIDNPSKTAIRFGLPALAGVLFALLALGGCRESAPSLSVEDVPEEHYSQPVATVNGRPVYASTYDGILVGLRARIPEDHPESVELYVGAKYRALEKVIDEELLYQEAIRRGYEPAPGEVFDEYRERVERIGSEEEYLAGARERRLSKSEVLDAIRRTVALDRFVKEEIESGLSVTDREAREFYERRPDLFTPEIWVKVGQITVAAPLDWPLDRRAGALSRITGALEGLQRGESFEDLAREVSEDASARVGGLLGYVKKGDLREELDEAAFSLAPGEVSGIIESSIGYHLVKSYARAGGKVRPFDEVKEEARERLFARKRSDALNTLLATLRAKAEIERMLR